MLGCLLQYTTNIGFNVVHFACFSRAQTANVMQLNLRLATTVELILVHSIIVQLDLLVCRLVPFVLL